jgi:steroid delta-isomerase
MPSPDTMAAAVDAYVAAFARGDTQGIVDLFRDDAKVEDPVGAEPIVGKPAITAFYGRATALGARLSLDGPVRTSGASAAFAFTVTVPGGQVTTLIQVIDVFDFDEAGLVTHMRAYWSEANVRALPSRQLAESS